MKYWKAKSTGNMTLSVISDVGDIILSVDMLRYQTMKAETDGDILVKAMNDLYLLSAIPILIGNSCQKIELPHPEAGLSLLPWTIITDKGSIDVLITDFNNKKIAERKYPKRMIPEKKQEIINTLKQGIDIINASHIL